MTDIPHVPVSWGELLDKITILEIKHNRLTDADQLANVERELDLLHDVAAPVIGQVEVFMDNLRAVNEALWDVEDAIREEDAAGRFGVEFIRLARAVYTRNDERACIKRHINTLLGSALVEEKSYKGLAQA